MERVLKMDWERMIPGHPGQPAFADWRPGDQKVFVSDIAKAKRDFGWFPKVSATSGVDRLADWVLQEKALLASVLG